MLNLALGRKLIPYRQVWGHTNDFGDFKSHDAARSKARRGIAIQPDAQGLNWGHARRGLLLRTSRVMIDRFQTRSPISSVPRGFGRCPTVYSTERRAEHPPSTRGDCIGLDILTQSGLWAELEPFLHRTWADGEFSFTCHGWERLMLNEDDVVYKELLLEFLSTV
ncbi:hypothetical protein L2E82_45633 [Cichorium intybus]|uniref:Uncharacterized protein n=1 Tax=Cichorium intybus TaxID=13427 RepID=A0ACB8ZTW0_CICIN|nr:hypothetical protein L2E82_45633 [Cichorium intybus]